MWVRSQTCPSLTDQACPRLPCSPIPFTARGRGLGTQISSASLVPASSALVLGEGRLALSSFLIIQVCFWEGVCIYFSSVRKRPLSD